ncbi:MAG: hypothetical protein LKJ69_01420 [Lactobacillus sp.]|jgi:hypothetical protein|nr:hypothetical protein [Lactobacillus sp.]MCI2032043.1 hypothetical protein [Lactobacillus sp.]
MKLPITIGDYKLTRDRDHRGMVALRGRDCAGSLEPDKLLDDLPRVIGRPLTIDEQVALTLAVPGVAA